MKKPRITLLTCTHNGERTIEQALEAITNQTDVSRDLFEVLVIDNASNDRTSEIAKTAIQHFNLNGQVLLEPRIGKINAFLRGVREAKGELISIIDDDNFIEPGFIRHTLDVFARYPNVGVVGSSNCVVVDQPLPAWFEWAAKGYACSVPYLEDTRTEADGFVIGQSGTIPGAGSSFRAKPVLECLTRGYTFINNTQRGQQMKVTGEDAELCWLIRSLGYELAYSPKIRIRHAIRADRLNLTYYKCLSKTVGAGRLGIDPFMFTHKCDESSFSTKWTWQWQLLSKVRRYLSLSLFPERIGNTAEEIKFNNMIAKESCVGAIQRIISERENYTSHIRMVASGAWTQLRVR